MAGKIFYRERTRFGERAELPRFRIIAVHDLDLKVYGDHFRLSELRAMADATGAELIELPRDEERGQKRRLEKVS